MEDHIDVMHATEAEMTADMVVDLPKVRIAQAAVRASMHRPERTAGSASVSRRRG